tara:strand:+ start:4141 stop:5031 length:891 start_codon:yes stop_codon:yes gene_type:complete
MTTATQIQFIQTGSKAINAVCRGKSFVIPPDHPRIAQIQEALANDDVSLFLDNANVSEAIEKFAHGDIQVVNGVVQYDGQTLHNVMTDRILELMSKDLPFLPMVLFLGRLLGNEKKKFPGNPSSRAVRELYPFLQIKGLPITQDGFFYAYKRLRDDWTDNWTGTISNKIGAKIPRMRRNLVDDNWGKDCSQGYHIGSLDFVRGFTMSATSSSPVIIVKCNPADVVSVPSKGCEKMRVCWYQVMAEYTSELETPGDGLTASPVYSGSSLTPIHSSSGRCDSDPLSDQPLGGGHIGDN